MHNLFETLKLTEKTHITSNSNDVKKGSIFCARIGKTTDGHNFIKTAIQKGAEIILHSKEISFELKQEFPDIKFIKDEKLEENLPKLLRKIYPLPEKIVAITGTNGKTSTSFLAAQSFSLMGFKSGFIGTLGILLFENGNYSNFGENSLTTPEVITMFRILNNFKKENVDFVFFEASSIGIEQGRIEGIPLSACCFTNFTQDHLDYHKTMENYFEAKALLFSKYLTKEGFAVLNKADTKCQELEKICEKKDCKVITFGAQDASVFASNINVFTESITFDCNIFQNAILNLVGKFQLENILCVISLAIGFNLEMERFKNILPLLKAPHGRLEAIPLKNANVFVDFAHTPDSLKKALETLKEITPKNGKLFVMFGCGGDRDKIKRPLMGKIASEIADFIIITDDNPRTEMASEIRKEIISGISKSNFKEIADRKEAIEFVIMQAGKNDIVLLAGKGSEDYQIIGTEKFPFNDFKIAEEILKNYSKEIYTRKT